MLPAVYVHVFAAPLQQQLLGSPHHPVTARLTTQCHRSRGQLILSPREGKKLLNPLWAGSRVIFHRKSRVITRPRAPPQFTPRITREMDVSQGERIKARLSTRVVGLPSAATRVEWGGGSLAKRDPWLPWRRGSRGKTWCYSFSTFSTFSSLESRTRNLRPPLLWVQGV